jgi:hypothetical protein
MVAVGISEFTFGYAFLFEQTQRDWANLRAAPVLPSLKQEEEEGWDARLPLVGTDYYYQFKLSDYLFRPHARYIKDGTYTEPYHRISLHRRENNKQHQRLKALASTNPNTFYVAPEFSGLDVFNQYFLSRQISERTRLIPVNRCQAHEDGDQHYITFQTGNKNWKEHSKTVNHQESVLGKEIESEYAQSREAWKTVNQDFAEEIFVDKVATIRRSLEHERYRDTSVANLLDIAPNERTTVGYLRRSAELLSVFFGVVLIVVGEAGQR